MRSKFWYWFYSWVWGFIPTLIGAIIFLTLRLACMTLPIKRNGWGYYTELGSGWGAVSFGPFAIVNKNPSQYLLDHEYGHSLQNCYLGPYAILIYLMSYVRWWFLRWYNKPQGKGIIDRFLRKVVLKKYVHQGYYSIWFENMASWLGTEGKKKIVQS